MKYRLASALLLSSLLFAGSAFAMDLHSARRDGLVGEKSDGYVSALKSSPDVEALVSDVNARRREEYAKISKQNGQPVDVVGQLAAEQIRSKLEPGASYQGAGGAWVKK